MKIIFSFILGIVANKLFTTFNTFKVFSFEITRENPFIYTITVREMLYFYSIVTFIFILIITIVYKDKESKLEIAKFSNYILKMEIIIFSFILGTQIFFKGKINLEFLEEITPLNIFIAILVSILNFCNYIFTLEKNSEKDLENLEEIYESRKFLLNAIENNLENMKSFSIVGEWGIGKSVLVKNFFYKNKKDYELIFIDSSIYSNNEKIIAVLENKIIKLLKKYNIFIKDKNIEEEIFIQSNNFISTIYNFLFRKTTIEDYRKEIRKKIEHINHLGKTTVICLDNLERLGSKERIKNLFAIVDELFPESIKKIYIYDEKEMERLFNMNGNPEGDNKKSNEFINYIEKYTFNKIEVNQVSIDEILDFIKNSYFKDLIEQLIYKLEKKYVLENFLYKIRNELRNNNVTNVKEVEDFISGKLYKKLEFIENKLKNPRYIINLFNNSKSFLQEKEILKYRVEYRITRDFLIRIDKKDIDIKSLGIPEIFEIDRINKPAQKLLLDIEEEKIERLCFYFLFYTDYDFKENKDNSKRIWCYQKFFNKLNINENLDDLKKRLPHDLLKVIDDILNFYPYQYVEKIKEILENMNSDYIINNTTELEHLFYLSNIEEYSDYLFRKIKINKELIVGEKDLIDAELLKIGMVNKYIENSSEIMKFFLLIYPKEKINIIIEQLEKGEFNFQFEKGFIFKKLESNKKFLKNIKIYEALNKILKMLEGFINTEETEIKKKENYLDKFNIEIIKGFSDEDKVFLKKIELVPEENDLIIKFINDITDEKQIIKILKEDIDKLEKRYIEMLEKIPKYKNLKDKNLESKMQLFLILLEKFKEKNIEKIEI